jgi:hypothetical protein
MSDSKYMPLLVNFFHLTGLLLSIVFIQQQDDELVFRRLQHRIHQMNADKHGDEIDVHKTCHIVEIDIKEPTACAGVIVKEIERAPGRRNKFVQ